MTAPTLTEVILIRHHTDGGRKVVQQVVRCLHPFCGCEVVIPVSKTMKPGDVIFNMARRRGWKIEGEGRKVRFCPKHKAKELRDQIHKLKGIL